MASQLSTLLRFLAPLLYLQRTLAIMKGISVLASLSACTLAQRLHIAEPTTLQSVQSSQNFTVDLQMDASHHSVIMFSTHTNFTPRIL